MRKKHHASFDRQKKRVDWSTLRRIRVKRVKWDTEIDDDDELLFAKDCHVQSFSSMFMRTMGNRMTYALLNHTSSRLFVMLKYVHSC